MHFGSINTFVNTIIAVSYGYSLKCSVIFLPFLSKSKVLKKLRSILVAPYCDFDGTSLCVLVLRGGLHSCHSPNEILQ